MRAPWAWLALVFWAAAAVVAYSFVHKGVEYMLAPSPSLTPASRSPAGDIVLGLWRRADDRSLFNLLITMVVAAGLSRAADCLGPGPRARWVRACRTPPAWALAAPLVGLLWAVGWFFYDTYRHDGQFFWRCWIEYQGTPMAWRCWVNQKLQWGEGVGSLLMYASVAAMVYLTLCLAVACRPRGGRRGRGYGAGPASDNRASIDWASNARAMAAACNAWWLVAPLIAVLWVGMIGGRLQLADTIPATDRYNDVELYRYERVDRPAPVPPGVTTTVLVLKTTPAGEPQARAAADTIDEVRNRLGAQVLQWAAPAAVLVPALAALGHRRHIRLSAPKGSLGGLLALPLAPFEPDSGTAAPPADP